MPVSCPRDQVVQGSLALGILVWGQVFSTEEAGGHLGLILIEELRAQVECGMFLKLRTHGVYHKRTPPSPVPCPEVFTGHCIYVSSHLPPPSTSSFKIFGGSADPFSKKNALFLYAR